MTIKGNLCVGKKAFYKGKEVSIIASTQSCWIVHEDKVRNNISTALYKKDVEARIQDVLPIGTKVRSFYSFEGKVTGYELETNRAVCISDKISNYKDLHERGGGDRTRFAYKATELTIVKKSNSVFEVGKRYLISFLEKREEIVVMIRPFEEAKEDWIIMENMANRNQQSFVVADLTVENLFMYGIDHVEEL